jgi:hypothetical protein
MPDQIDRERWANLARELGLEPEPESLPDPAVAEPVEEPPTESAGVDNSSEAEETIPEEPSAPPGLPKPEPSKDAVEQPLEDAVPVPKGEESFPAPSSQSIEEPAATDPPEAEERRPSGRRRRRGSSRGSRKAPADATVSAVPTSTEEPETTPPERSSRRRSSGRGRKKTAEVPLAGPAATDAADALPQSDIPVTEAGDEEDLSTWNIPSWQELIASLYRPDH